MAAISSNAGLVLPTNAGDSGLWGNENNATIASLDTRLAGTTTILSSVSGLSYTISSADAQCGRLVLGGIPAGPATWNFSSGKYAMGEYAVWNTSTGFGLTCQTPGGGATCTIPVGSQRVVTTDGTNAYFADQVPIPVFTFPPVLPGYLYGLGVSNDATSPSFVLDIAPGFATDTTAVSYIQLPSGITKSAGTAWSSGTGQGGMGVGLSFTANTTYHVFLISNGVTSGIDVYFDTSPTAANAPANTNYYRRLLSLKVPSSGAVWNTFIQDGDYVYIPSVIEYSGGARALAALTLTGVPTGIVVQPILNAEVAPAANSQVIVYVAPVGKLSSSTWPRALANVVSGAGVNAGAGNFTGPPTNLSGQVGYQVSVGGGVSVNQLLTYGYVDRRGQDGVP